MTGGIRPRPTGPRAHRLTPPTRTARPGPLPRRPAPHAPGVPYTSPTHAPYVSPAHPPPAHPIPVRSSP